MSRTVVESITQFSDSDKVWQERHSCYDIGTEYKHHLAEFSTRFVPWYYIVVQYLKSVLKLNHWVSARLKSMLKSSWNMSQWLGVTVKSGSCNKKIGRKQGVIITLWMYWLPEKIQRIFQLRPHHQWWHFAVVINFGLLVLRDDSCGILWLRVSNALVLSPVFDARVLGLIVTLVTKPFGV